MPGFELMVGKRRIEASGVFVSLTTVIAVVVCLWNGFRWLDTRFSQIEQAQIVTHQKIERLTEQVKFAASDRFSLTDARQWSKRLKDQNDKLRVPDPEHLGVLRPPE